VHRGRFPGVSLEVTDSWGENQNIRAFGASVVVAFCGLRDVAAAAAKRVLPAPEGWVIFGFSCDSKHL
jgi:hypothetical protein